MQADYAAYAKANGVLPMPDGHDPQQQVLINSLVNVYVPRYRNTALTLVAGLIVLAASVVVRGRRRKASRPEFSFSPAPCLPCSPVLPTCSARR